ncbi:hypothetical protein EIN_253350 [Entamoeba invadens IP1]|uniref:C2H2-type domain-containing protein n=1 Tax=Entamoeba invadens IP1 TaxID=370355 RepID=A0A0A1UEQ9_ENTIV|nr:hypothetical protein EIN_253350 [Entamoeba invadens IP1]ELP95071.1 hypothetical protein EIN_253350 [Entamoeba invadens IP1]|eukprot:XP_004261842.1 hypothetical protein EIN_253350 [Entamoeba invadens IP1]
MKRGQAPRAPKDGRLQKTKYYCEMCKKQCHDENGFKNHCQSETHRRNMALYSEDPNKYNKDFNTQFLNGYMRIVQTQYRRKWVNSNVVYNQYIQDRTNVHMNSTQWNNLSGFVHALAERELVELEERAEGTFIKYKEEEESEEEEKEEEVDEGKRIFDEMVKQVKMKGIEERDVGEMVVREKPEKKMECKIKMGFKTKKKPVVIQEEVTVEKEGDKKKRKMPIANPNQPALSSKE